MYHGHTGAVRHGLEDASGEQYLFHIRAENALSDSDLIRSKRPRPRTAHEEGITKLRFTSGFVLQVAERPVERTDTMRDAGIDHTCDGVVPQVLLKECSLLLAVFRISQDAVRWMATTNAGRLHATRGSQIGRPQAQTVHAGLAPQISSTFMTRWAVSSRACRRIGFLTSYFASSKARYWSTKWISHGPSTLGIMITSSLLPTAFTISVMSSRNQGLFNAFTRVQSAVSPKSVALATSMKPARAASLESAGIPSSRLPHATSTCFAVSDILARILSMCGGKKWIMRSGRTGSSRSGCGAPIASDL